MPGWQEWALVWGYFATPEQRAKEARTCAKVGHLEGAIPYENILWAKPAVDQASAMEVIQAQAYLADESCDVRPGMGAALAPRSQILTWNVFPHQIGPLPHLGNLRGRDLLVEGEVGLVHELALVHGCAGALQVCEACCLGEDWVFEDLQDDVLVRRRGGQEGERQRRVSQELLELVTLELLANVEHTPGLYQ